MKHQSRLKKTTKILGGRDGGVARVRRNGRCSKKSESYSSSFKIMMRMTQ
jgi:hypothetical protein